MKRISGLTMAVIAMAALAGFGASQAEAGGGNRHHRSARMYDRMPAYYSPPIYAGPSYSAAPYRSFSVNVGLGGHYDQPRSYVDHRSYRSRGDGHDRGRGGHNRGHRRSHGGHR